MASSKKDAPKVCPEASAAEKIMNGTLSFFVPIPSVIKCLRHTPSDEPLPLPRIKGFAWSPLDVYPFIISSLRCAFFAYLVMQFELLFPLAEAREYRLDWMLRVVLRDLAAVFFLAGTWDYILYLSPLAPKLHHLKFNPEYPSKAQMLSDMFHSCVTSVCSSGLEILMLHWWATGAAPYTRVEWFNSREFLVTAIWCATIDIWRLTHFYWVHRAMHPWKTTKIPDIGQILYTHVHALHHKANNPSAWSGIRMHPIEGTIYYTAAFIPVFFGAHPIVFLATKISLGMGAIIGHDGFRDPGHASFIHYLHHAKFDCNYSENVGIPWDYIFGSFYDGTTSFVEWRQSMRKKAA